MLTPSKLLFFYKEGYTYIWEDLKKIEGKSIQYIKLIPMDSQSESSHFVLGINMSTKNIYSITDIGNNGTQTEFKIEELKFDQDIAANLFTLDEGKYTSLDYTINK